MKKLKHSNRYLLLAIGWLIVSTILLTLPGSAFPKEDWLNKIYFDKWVHIGMFAAMAYLTCSAIYYKTNNTGKLLSYFILAGLGCVIYGIIMEFIQRDYIPYRGFDEMDIVADTAGTIIGVLISAKRYIKK